MSRQAKLLAKFLGQPKDFTWNELSTLLKHFGFVEISGGRTGGSRVRFYLEDYPSIMLHKPHPEKTLKPYMMKEIKKYLENEGFI